ncbi:protein NEN1-like [Prunus yedoensis var. nudiflora]|uniref:Protein NEN1-like n=1 Tax=Prunus yedoensis var. nudiflora TaxID=2094558 RepID=A0A314ZG32_PRUYE|nr:protein NEN1-like [Prunus yedoensis var. nudiflora]
MVRSEDRFEIAFFDLETTKPGQEFIILEFGAILVCPRKLVELDNYSTLVRPADLSSIASLPMRSNGINRDTVASSPTFQDIADEVYDILHGRIWAGHNILGFDCARIQEAFAHIGRPAPKPKGYIDSLALLRQRFGRRAGDMKMETLANYFGLGPQEHRSLADVRMNLEVLKYCATVLFLESSLPDAAVGFLEPDQVFIPSIYPSLVPSYSGSQRIKLLYDLQLCCRHMKLRFGININSKFSDNAGRPKLDIIADASPNLCKVLDACNDIASKFSVDSGSNSEWKPVVIWQQGFYDYPAVRLHIPASGDIRI